MGEHAGEIPEIFIARKKADIADLGYTFWYARSVQPPKAREFCDGGDPTFVLFYERNPENRRKPQEHAGEKTNTGTKKFGYMTRYCEGNREVDPFLPIPDALLRPGRFVTGLVDRGSCGLVFDDLAEVEPERPFDSNEWASVFKKNAQAGAWCAVRSCTPTQVRQWYIVAVARMCKPYAVWFQGEYGLPVP